MVESFLTGHARRFGAGQVQDAVESRYLSAATGHKADKGSRRSSVAGYTIFRKQPGNESVPVRRIVVICQCVIKRIG